MIEKKPDSFSDIVDRAMGELRSSPVPPELPPELLDALLQAAKENTGAVQRTVEASAQAEIIHPTLPTHSLDTSRRIMRSPISRVAAAPLLFLRLGDSPCGSTKPAHSLPLPTSRDRSSRRKLQSTK